MTPTDGAYLLLPCDCVDLLRQMSATQVRNTIVQAMHRHSRGQTGTIGFTHLTIDQGHTTVFWTLTPTAGTANVAVFMPEDSGTDGGL